MKRLIAWLRPRGYRGELLVGPLDRLHPVTLMYEAAVFINTLEWPRWRRGR